MNIRTLRERAAALSIGDTSMSNEEIVEDLVAAITWSATMGERWPVTIGPESDCITYVAFTSEEAEACRTFGADRYESEAQRVEIECERQSEAIWNEYTEAWKAVWGPQVGYETDGDDAGELGESARREEEADAARKLAKRRSLRGPLPGEGPGDWAARFKLKTADQLRIPHDEWATLVAAEMDAVRRGDPVER